MFRLNTDKHDTKRVASKKQLYRNGQETTEDLRDGRGTNVLQ
jgi:hypothetical protein